MALQSDSKEMGKVKIHMIIGDSDSQFSKTYTRMPYAQEWAGANKRIRQVPDMTEWMKNQKIIHEDEYETGILNEEKHV